jgi:hypothetical protein
MPHDISNGNFRYTPGTRLVIDGSRFSGRATTGGKFSERLAKLIGALASTHQSLTPDIFQSAQYFVAIIVSHVITQN